jgi:acyl transferase domain-containing protein
MNNDYDFMGKSGIDMSNFNVSGTETSLASNRISYHYDLHGPSMTINTACSSSLVGVHLACQSIHSEEAEFAVVGGWAPL